jgi:S-disulfanyl-L-cysteine oxidoreductase SoxD
MRPRRDDRRNHDAREAAGNGLLDRRVFLRGGAAAAGAFRGLPPGSGTAAQGATVYAQKCQACHGEKGVGGPNDRLVGGQGTLASKTPLRTVGSYWPYATTVFDYVRRAMPFVQPLSLTDGEVYALTAYLLNVNGIIGEQDVMNAETLPRVKMPNRDNFILVHPWKPKTP